MKPPLLPKEAELLACASVEVITEARRKEAVLKAGILQNAILNSANFSSIATDEKGVIQVFNVGAERMLGYAAADVLNKSTPAEISDPQELIARATGLSLEFATPIAPGFEALVFKASRGIEDIYELTYIRKDGSRFPAVVSVTALRDAQAGIIGYLLIGTDNTERKAAEEKLKASTKEVLDLKAALDEHAIVAITDSRGKIAFVNDKFCTISKYSRAELIGQDHRIINSGYHPKAFIHELWTTIGRGRVWHGEIKNKAKDGSFYWVDTTIVPFLDDQGKPRQYVAIRADITERKTAEEKLKASTKEVLDLKAALDEHAIVAITDSRGKITFVNDKFCTISKYSREELLGQDHRIINSGYHPKEFIHKLWTTIGHGRVWHGEIKNKAKDGSFYWVDTTIVPFLDDRGKPRQYVAIRADITERKAAEGTVRQLNTELEQRVIQRTAELETANKELEAFSYSVSHDLRAPLRAVDGFSQAVLLDYGPQLPEEGRRYLQTIRGGAQRMGALIDDLLTFARLNRQELNKRVIDTGKLVRDALDELGSPWSDRSVEILARDLPASPGDPVLLKQVWLNLLSNALKYTRKREKTVVEIGCMKTNGAETFFVRDNGTGFDMRYANKLFGVFQRLHRAEDYEGTGVGLAIVQRIIQRHGGRVWGEAAIDRGATFYFTLEKETTS
ncbi:MAG TPA: PAS domain S-box protein [Opitutaceae bacterium]|jgi:PAS domain S-box-containing protein|nr:PAS domain S-box protein [Opitutaceae bacterium]